MKILIVNGPNLNLLGIREPELYGRETYADLCDRIRRHAELRGVDAEIVQSNHEGDLIDAVQNALGTADALILNPAGYTHTSIALADAVKAVGLPAAEVHLTDPDKREDYRKISYIRPACAFTVKGRGIDGYLEAIDRLIGAVGENA